MTPPNLTPEQIDLIAERAAEVALQKVYAQIGKSIVTKLLWIVGAAALALIAMNPKDLFK